MTLAPRSLKALEGIHPDLVKVVRRADELGAKFHITDGLRTPERQKQLVKAGKSKTMRSRHLTGHAVDFVVAEPGGGVSYDHADMKACAAVFKQAAAEIGIPIEWGGDWKGFVDTPHIQLPWKQYPAGAKAAAAGPEPAVEPVAAVPAGPVVKSGTVWGSLGALGGTVMMYLEESFQTLVETGARLAEIGWLSTIGANSKALAMGLTAGCVALVIGRRIKAKQEGKSG